VLACVFALNKVGAEAVERQVIVAFDEIYAIRFFRQNLRPYRRRNGMEPAELLQAAAKDYPSLLKRCENFDQELMADMTKVGGVHYARICALAYRERVAARGLVADANKQPPFFTKEKTSIGDIATVGDQGMGQLNLSGGTIQASTIVVGTSGAPGGIGTLTVAGGNLNVSAGLILGTGTVWVSGGQLLAQVRQNLNMKCGTLLEGHPAVKYREEI
jgi:hypothetical protein